MNKGIIALDIDGTVTADIHGVPGSVENFLAILVSKGWSVVFITGRNFAWGADSLCNLTFPHYMAVQNGAIIFHMPEAKIVAKKYLDTSIFAGMDAICKDLPTDYVIYAGFEYDDVCYYRPKRFDPDLLTYVLKRAEVLKEKWIPLESFDQLPIKAFPSIKCFSTHIPALELTVKIEGLGLHAPIIQDPFDLQMRVIQATDGMVNKGEALKNIIELKKISGPVIVAGDGYNDLSMLKIADVKVVMETAPKEVLAFADIIAPSAEEEGIIQGLEKAIALLETR